MPGIRKHALLVLILLALAAAARAEDYVWWEGEAAADHNFNSRDFPPSAYGDRRAGLSGGDWLFNGGPRHGDELHARWRVDVPSARTWNFWTRKFWKHGPFRWRFDAQPWQTCGKDCALADTYELATHICANWVALGTVDLAAGRHEFEVRLLAAEGENAVACFDAFLLVAGSFQPRGNLKPGEKSGRASEGWWAFEPDPDPLAAGALLDLRALNEREAGAAGFVRAAGDGFQLGDGKPVRFWGVNAGPDIVRLAPAQVDYLAARLARAGVNLVRIHGAIFDAHDPAKIDAALVEKVFAFVAALKKQGIYSALSIYFPLWIDPHPFGQIYFDPAWQVRWQAWAKALFGTPPGPGHKPLSQDPAVAYVELVNEDSLFFWTFSDRNISANALAPLETRFGAWLARAYGSLAKGLPAGARHPRDDAGAGRAGLFGAWDMTGAGLAQANGDKKRRVADQVKFLAETQRDFYASMKRWLKETLGAKVLVCASNWKTADERVLGPVERWTYASCDVIDRHGYFGGRHEGPRASYAVDVGDTFADRAAVLEPEAPPLAFVQNDGAPHVISEIGWNAPNRLRADAPMLASVYGALQGVDGFEWFALNGPGWVDSLPKFPVSDPAILGQFPAAALSYRRGDVKAGPEVFHESFDDAALFALGGSGAVEPMGLDAARAQDAPGAADAAAALDPLAFYVGRVVRGFGAAGAPKRVDLGKYLDRKRKLVRSATGELAWDWGGGVVTVNAPRSQGAAGCLGKAGAQKLEAVTIACRNEYAAVWAISLDERPLRESKKLLVQAFTECRPFGFRADDAGKIVDLGGPPLEVREIDAEITLPGTPPTRVTALDPHGYAAGAVEFTPGKAETRVRLPRKGMYVMVER